MVLNALDPSLVVTSLHYDSRIMPVIVDSFRLIKLQATGKMHIGIATYNLIQ